MATNGVGPDGDSGQILDPDLAVEDDEYVRRRRLKAINDARDRVAEVGLRARLEQMEGNIRSIHREAVYTEAVQSFLIQAEMVIRKIEGSEKLLKKEELGSWRLSPPSTTSGCALLSINGLEHCKYDPERREVTAVGLRSLYESSAVYTVHWKITEERHIGENRISNNSSMGVFPEHVSRQAFSRAVRLLDKAGINYMPRQDEGEPMIREFDQSGEVPSGELVQADYTGDPEI